MCGITGIVHRKEKLLDGYSVIDRMLESIRHRGPDDTGVCGITSENKLLLSNSASDISKPLKGILGFNRLSIQDITRAGHQPMLSEDEKVVITFNGEIYNVQELRRKLVQTGKYIFRGTSDTECILYLYEECGFKSMVEQLNGMFSIVIYDSKIHTLFFARDRFGIIPLHVWVTNEYFVWTSELKAFLEMNFFPRELSYSAISNGLMFCYPNDSMYKNVYCFEPGKIMEWDMGNDIIKEYMYFSINDYHQKQMIKEHDYLEEATEILRNCIKRQLISDVDLGVQFSGGVDSTLIAHYVSDNYREAGKKLFGFSLINSGSRKFDEEKWIDRASLCNDMYIQKIDMNIEKFVMGLEKGLYGYERLVNIPSPIGIYYFSRKAKEYVTVLMSGEGADELCGGYGSFSKYHLFEPYFRRHSGGVERYDSVNAPIIFFEKFDGMLSQNICQEIFPDFSCEEELEKRKEYWRKLDGTPFDKIRKLYFKYTLISLLERQNKICMSNSIENRVPFLDNEFVEYMFTIPEKLLLHKQIYKVISSGKLQDAYEGKYLLKLMSSNIYGKKFAFRQKQAIRVPLQSYLKHPKMQTYIQDIILPGMKKRGLVNVEVFMTKMRDIDHEMNAMAVWKAVNLELWCQFFLDGRKGFTFNEC